MHVVQMSIASDLTEAARSARETLRLFHEAEAWIESRSACVCRTPMGSAEHVAVILPSGVSSQFLAEEPGDYEQGIVLAVEELCSPASGTHEGCRYGASPGR